jgi:hypothetical protein
MSIAERRLAPSDRLEEADDIAVGVAHRGDQLARTDIFDLLQRLRQLELKILDG